MMIHARVLACALASAVAFSAPLAQDAPNLSGRVKSVTGAPIDGVEVRIDGTSMSVRTDHTGSFAFAKAPKGPQLLLFRLLGYLPTTEEVRVPTTIADTIDVTMLPTPQALATVKVVASVNVLAGVVVDDKDKPVPGATVEMLNGNSTGATTDSSGWFTFTSVRSGSVLVRARKLGFAPLTTSIRLEDWRGLVIHLEPLDYNLSASKLEDASGFGNTSKFVWTETQQRLAVRGLHAVIVPREELAPYDDYHLGEALVRTKTGAIESADLNAVGHNTCVLLNGKSTVGPTSLDSFRAADVEFVEIYPPGTEQSGSVAQYLRNSGCRRVRTPGSFDTGVFYVVVWLRT
jgi:hypothetical protein